MKKILITAYHFYPEINPRAFRTFELAKEFSRRGYKVDIVLPDKGIDYRQIEQKFNLTINVIKPGFFLNLNKSLKSTNNLGTINKLRESYFITMLKFFAKCIYIGGKSFEYAFTLSHFLKNFENRYDVAISVSFPISVHLGTAWYLNRLTKKIISIADCGDPFSFNPEIKPKCFYFRFIEQYILKPFNYVTIPTSSAIKEYSKLKDLSTIKVIPQSFDTKMIKIEHYNKNRIPTFGYAGMFYTAIRNPKILFEYLLELHNIDFKFIIYTNTNDQANMELINPYKKILKEKLEIYSLIPREDCIYQLSRMDFIINQSNITLEQKASKIIDYMLSRRPIFEFNQNIFDKTLFFKYLNGEYDVQINYDEALKEFKLENVVDSFELLING